MSVSDSQRAASRRTTYNAVWNTADKYLRNVVEPEEYGDYIIPFTVLRRLECMIADTKPQVLQKVEEYKRLGPEAGQRFLDLYTSSELRIPFYNTSSLDLKIIGSADDHVADALRTYVGSFSRNVADIWDKFKFDEKIATLDAAGRLFGVVNHFASLDFSLEAMPDNAMGSLFEDIMYRAFNTKGKSAGAFYTPRDAIELVVDVLFASDDDGLHGQTPIRRIYDPAAGTGGMLLVAARKLCEINPNIQLSLRGQELMDFAYGIGKADLLIQGGSADSILQGDTLITDLLDGQTFDYVLTNPPYGTDWTAEYESVSREAEIPDSRFSHGLPPKSDGQMLFLEHVAHKLTPAHGETGGGRAGIVMNGSPLFTGRPGSGPDRIRQWILTSDLVDAIIALPTDMFYGTGIATYVWILDTNKEPSRRGTIQLIDATSFWTAMRKGMGDKRREITEDDAAKVVALYREHKDGEHSRIVTADELGFKDVPVYQQRHLRVADAVTDAIWEKVAEHKSAKPEHRAVLEAVVAAHPAWNNLPELIGAEAKAQGLRKPGAGLLDATADALAVDDDAAPLAFDRKGRPVTVPGSEMTERVPLTEDVDEHMRREVLPFAPESIWDEDAAKTGYEIPFTRIFYKPTPVRPLEEIDADVQRVMSELTEMFREVQRDE